MEILRAIAHGSSLLIFDEPTSSLSHAESAEVFRIVREMRDRGTSIIYITHRMDELRELGIASQCCAMGRRCLRASWGHHYGGADPAHGGAPV